MKSSFKPRLVLFQNPMLTQWICIIILQFLWESHAFTLIITFIMFHQLVSIVLNNHLLRDCYMQVIRDSYKTQCSLSSGFFFFFPTNWNLVWNIIMVLFSITYSTMFYFIYWSKPSQYPLSSGNDTQNTKVPAFVHLGQHFTPGYAAPLHPFLSLSCSFLWLLSF